MSTIDTGARPWVPLHFNNLQCFKSNGLGILKCPSSLDGENYFLAPIKSYVGRWSYIRRKISLMTIVKEEKQASLLFLTPQPGPDFLCHFLSNITITKMFSEASQAKFITGSVAQCWMPIRSERLRERQTWFPSKNQQTARQSARTYTHTPKYTQKVFPTTTACVNQAEVCTAGFRRRYQTTEDSLADVKDVALWERFLSPFSLVLAFNMPLDGGRGGVGGVRYVCCRIHSLRFCGNAAKLRLSLNSLSFISKRPSPW